MNITRMTLAITVNLDEILANLDVPGCRGLDSYDYRIEDVERLDGSSFELTIERND